MKSILYIAALAAMSAFTVSCTDDLAGNFSWSDGDGSLSMDVGFTSFGTALDTRAATGGTPGNAIDEVNDLQVLFYSNVDAKDDPGKETGDLKYVFTGTPTDGGDGSGKADFTFTRVGEERNPADGPTPDTGISESTNTTRHMTFQLNNVERGRYRIYVVANMPSGFDATKDAGTVEALRNYKLKWDGDDIKANNAMFGYFGVGDWDEKDVINQHAPIIPVSGPMKMHAWIKRAVSKVTVAFDGTRLDENVYIYIKSVQLRDIPDICLLGAKNTPNSKDDLISGVENDSKEKPATPLTSSNSIIVYNSQAGATGESITRGNPRFPRPGSGQSEAEWKANMHSPTSDNSLFFFENMQGEGTAPADPSNPTDPDGSYKPQTDEGHNRIPDDKDNDIQKDSHPNGTYIEVKAYYVNNGNYEVSRGDITYRFMLGKNVTTSFDAERSIHYKVTLQFNNNANDVDWHIDIDEDHGIYAPEEYYVSYGYGEVSEYPIRIVGTMTGYLKAEIIENNWGGNADKAAALNQYTGQIYFGRDRKATNRYQLIPADPEHDASLQPVTNGICNGFLQLRKLKSGEEFEIGANTASDTGAGIRFNETYWYDNKLGVREYSGDGAYENGDGDNLGKYVANTDVEGTTSFTIPLYTRQMKLMSTTSYSGMNPYYSLEGTREAKIRFTATVDGKQVVKIVKILQRPRIENPTGIWRAHNSSAPFDVTLQYRETESETNLRFSPVHSIGPWSAEIEQGSFFTLSVSSDIGRNERNDSIHGFTGTDVKFRVEFNGTCSSTEARCGIILIKYHNYSCTHRIFVRQGYAPLAIVNNGAKWHSFNLVANGQEASHPCEEGSMFRPGNLSQPISEGNNLYGNFNISPGNLNVVSGVNVAWDRIDFTQYNLTTPEPFKNSLQQINNHSDIGGYTSSRMPTWKDFRPFIHDSNVKLAFGILYADGATKEDDSNAAFNYTQGSTGTSGMRGVFIYNTNNGRNIFLPIGKSGYGRRQTDGVLRYAGRGELMDGQLTFKNDGTVDKNNRADYRPLLYNIYSNQGAIYWSGRLDFQDDKKTGNSHVYKGCTEGVKQGDFDNGLNPNFAFDFNYKTYDCNGFGTNQATGACYIRLVSD